MKETYFKPECKDNYCGILKIVRGECECQPVESVIDHEDFNIDKLSQILNDLSTAKAEQSKRGFVVQWSCKTLGLAAINTVGDSTFCTDPECKNCSRYLTAVKGFLGEKENKKGV